MTAQEISSLDPYEGYPNIYNRINITMNTFEQNAETGRMEARNIDGQAYVRVKENEPFVFPCIAYLRACCKTIYSNKKLQA